MLLFPFSLDFTLSLSSLFRFLNLFKYVAVPITLSILFSLDFGLLLSSLKLNLFKYVVVVPMLMSPFSIDFTLSLSSLFIFLYLLKNLDVPATLSILFSFDFVSLFLSVLSKLLSLLPL